MFEASAFDVNVSLKKPFAVVKQLGSRSEGKTIERGEERGGAARRERRGERIAREEQERWMAGVSCEGREGEGTTL